MGIFKISIGKCNLSNIVITKRNPNDIITARKGYIGSNRQKDCTNSFKKYWSLHVLVIVALVMVLTWLLRRQSQYNVRTKEDIATTMRGTWMNCDSLACIHSTSDAPIVWKFTKILISITPAIVYCRERERCCCCEKNWYKVIRSSSRRRYSVAKNVRKTELIASKSMPHERVPRVRWLVCPAKSCLGITRGTNTR